MYATLKFKICHNHIYPYRNHPSPSTATCTPNKHRTHSPKLRLLLVYTFIRRLPNELDLVPYRLQHLANFTCVRLESHVLIGQKNQWKPLSCVPETFHAPLPVFQIFIATRGFGPRAEGSRHPQENLWYPG